MNTSTQPKRRELKQVVVGTAEESTIIRTSFKDSTPRVATQAGRSVHTKVKLAGWFHVAAFMLKIKWLWDLLIRRTTSDYFLMSRVQWYC